MWYNKEHEDFPELMWQQFLNDEISYFKEKGNLLTKYKVQIKAIIEVLNQQLESTVQNSSKEQMKSNILLKTSYQDSHDSVRKFLDDWMEGIESDQKTIISRINNLTKGFDPLHVNCMINDLKNLIEDMEARCVYDPDFKPYVTEVKIKGTHTRMERAKELLNYVETVEQLNI